MQACSRDFKVILVQTIMSFDKSAEQLQTITLLGLHFAVYS